MERQCIILHESVSQDKIDSSDRERWVQVIDIIQRDPENGTPEQFIFRTLDSQTLVRHIIDSQSGYPFLLVEGESIDETVKKIYSLFPTYSRKNVFRMVRHPVDSQEYYVGILYLGLLVLGQKYDPEIFEQFRQILKDETPGVRTSAMYGMSFPAWPEFRDLLKPLAENDSDVAVRETAIRFLEGLELYPSPSTS
jgi:HEAT repeats